MRSVLIVCTANQCRSPMAMAILRSKTGQLPGEWKIESAGTWAVEGAPANQKTQQVVAELGLDLRDHKSRMVRREMLAAFNLILVMEPGQKEALQIEFPEAASRTFLLSEMIGLSFTIIDPVGGEIEDYRVTAREIDHILAEGLGKIDTLAQG
jgi:protein-tyrosine phosphatase